ncbi:MAG: carbohydrate ABC transporter permease [Candidatus Promineifilaceae bacterium]|jgi:trehalose/maltose transport system permease protein
MTTEAAAVDKKPKKEGTSDLAKQEQRLAYLLLVPTLIVLVLIAFYPLGSVFVYSLTDRKFASGEEPTFVGLENYKNLLSMTIVELPPALDDVTGERLFDEETGEPKFVIPVEVLPREPKRYRAVTTFDLFGNRYVLGATDPNFILAVRDTLIYSVISVTLELILGMGIALLVNFSFPGRGMMRVLMLVPWAIPTAVSSRIWQWMFASTRAGVINVILLNLGIIDQPVAWLVNETFQIPAMIVIDVWKTTPFMALLLLAGLQLIPSDIYEAADVDGAGKIRQFISLTLPLLMPTIAVALVFRTLDALRVFDLFQIVLAQSRYSMASYAYYELLNGQRMGYSSAVSVLILIIIAVFAVMYIRLLGVTEDD